MNEPLHALLFRCEQIPVHPLSGPAAPAQAIRRFNDFLGREATLRDLSLARLTAFVAVRERTIRRAEVEADVDVLLAVCRDLEAAGYRLPGDNEEPLLGIAMAPPVVCSNGESNPKGSGGCGCANRLLGATTDLNFEGPHAPIGQSGHPGGATRLHPE